MNPSAETPRADVSVVVPCHNELETLPEDQSRVIELAYFGGFSHSQIADMLEMPVGTVKGRMRLGLEKLRNQLSEALA